MPAYPIASPLNSTIGTREAAIVPWVWEWGRPPDGGSLLGTLLGGSDAGGLIGSLLDMGGVSSAPTTFSRGTTIIADPRLNALIVQAAPNELDFIEQILRVLDGRNRCSASPIGGGPAS